MKVKNAKMQRRRRILLLADFSYASAKSIASGAIRFVSVHQGLDFLIQGGHPGNADAAYAASSGIDGIISCLGTNRRTLGRVLDANPRCPVVFASVVRGLAAVRGVRSAAIVCDHGAIAKAAAALLLRHGLQAFAYVGARHQAARARWDDERRRAFVSAIASAGFQAGVYAPADADAGADADFASLGAWLRDLPKPCGLFASYDQRAMHVLGVCRAEGISVPEQIQIIGAANEAWICDHTSPTLTSVEPDFEGCGYRAAETLLRLMDGEECAPVATFGVKEIAHRMSTTDIHGSVNRAVRARNYLRGHAAEPLSVAELATHLGCSTRALQLSYRAVFGRTVQDDLAETRLEMAKALLADTDIPICDIPGRIGFSSPNHLLRLFRRRTGMTMLQFRRGILGRPPAAGS